MINRRQFIKKLSGLSAILIKPSFIFAKQNIYKIGVLAPSHCALPVVLAKCSDLFKKAGINAEIVFANDMTDIVKGLSNGELHFGQVTYPISFAINSSSEKFPKFNIVATQVLGTNGGILGVHIDSGIKKLSDLKGKTIGVHSPFMIHSLILNVILEKSGLVPGKSVKIKNIHMSKLFEALKQRQIDAFINPEPLPYFLEQKGMSKSILPTRMFWLNHPCCLLCTNRNLYEKETNFVKDFTYATTVAGLKLDNPVLRKNAIFDVHKAFPVYNKIPLDYLLNAFKPRASDFYPFPFQSSGIIITNQMKKYSLIPSNLNNLELVKKTILSELSLEIIKKAKNEIPGTAMPPGLNRKEVIKII